MVVTFKVLVHLVVAPHKRRNDTNVTRVTKLINIIIYTRRLISSFPVVCSHVKWSIDPRPPINQLQQQKSDASAQEKATCPYLDPWCLNQIDDCVVSGSLTFLLLSICTLTSHMISSTTRSLFYPWILTCLCNHRKWWVLLVPESATCDPDRNGSAGSVHGCGHKPTTSHGVNRHGDVCISSKFQWLKLLVSIMDSMLSNARTWGFQCS